MSFLGTFDGFTTARLAIIAAQTGLNVTGNNIANISTPGYTRQVLDQVSLKTGGNDRYAAEFQLRTGTGVLCTSISQIRDPYLDIRYRKEMASVGATDTWLAGLNDIAATLDEVGTGKNDGDGQLYAQIGALRDALNELNTDAGQEIFDNLTRETADTMCTLFNQYARDLNTLTENTIIQLNQDLSRVNEILTSIRELNSEIRTSDIHKDKALEMRDSRNNLIDELSQYMKIDVTYEMEDLGGGDWVEKLVIKLGNANPEITDTENATLVDGIYAVQFELPEFMPTMNTDPDIYGDGMYLKAVLNPKYDPNDPTTGGMYMKNDGSDDTTDNITEAYIATDEISEAFPTETENSHFDLFLTALKDERDRVMKIHGKEVPPAGQLDDNDLYGSLQSTRELLTEKGEFATADDIAIDEKAASKRGIPFYQMTLDLLARKIADTLNEANQGYPVDQNGNFLENTGTKEKPVYQIIDDPTLITYYTDANGNYVGYIDANNVFVGDVDPADLANYDQKTVQLQDQGKTTAAQQACLAYLEENYAASKLGGNLFSNLSDGDDDIDPPITAGNISIAHSWSVGDVHIVTTFIKPFDGDLIDSTQNKNVEYMVTLFDKDMIYNPQDLDPDAVSEYLFNGSFQEMYDRIGVVLGQDQTKTGLMLNVYYSESVELNASRDGVSGVDLNDESMNMMQYQKALTAAYRLMTVLDEALDKLISNTGVVGR